jgi:hypothetical protein
MSVVPSSQLDAPLSRGMTVVGDRLTVSIFDIFLLLT